jgi:small-conductance mechanosensitive channel
MLDAGDSATVARAALEHWAEALPRSPAELWAFIAGREWPLLRWLVVSLAAFALGRALAWCVIAALQRWSRLTRTAADDIAMQHVGQPLRWLGPLALLALALPQMSESAEVRAVLRQLLTVAITLVFGWLFLRIARMVEEIVGRRLSLDASVKARAEYTQLRGLRNIADFLIGVITVGLALLSVGDVRQLGASLLASAGVAGIVFGFAAQRSLATILTGLVIAIAQPIRINDIVVVEGEFGSIEEITLTFVVVRLWDQRRLVLPVSYFTERPFQCWSRSSTELTGVVLLNVDYAVPVDSVRAELGRIVKHSPHWNQRSWALEVTETTEHTVVLRAQMSADDSGAAWKLRCEVRERLIGFLQQQCPESLPRLRTSAVAGAPTAKGRRSARLPMP